jgi:Ca2+/H+ antiporter, TMEM165/GDT1 family
VLAAALTAFGTIFVAELGDKTQVLAIALASRMRATIVLAGLFLGEMLVMAVSVAVGGALATAVPDRALAIGGGLLFLAFAAWTAFGGEEEDADGDAEAERLAEGRSGLRQTIGVTGLFVVAELGDKTMLVAFTLAAANGVVGTYLGATLAMFAVSALSVAVGATLGRRLSPDVLRWVSAGLFLIFGLWLLWDGLSS